MLRIAYLLSTALVPGSKGRIRHKAAPDGRFRVRVATGCTSFYIPTITIWLPNKACSPSPELARARPLSPALCDFAQPSTRQLFVGGAGNRARIATSSVRLVPGSCSGSAPRKTHVESVEQQVPSTRAATQSEALSQ
ncbi:hypothetical protein P171DRAFT_162979 [Karstenula rhodostoma CBS 690.94]|uniref:Uncharacterized protein n=1 Tax=Karstenula rhodostoma CBS 690.94 TaxID=1392251 RepID=A0A9P4P552_9PLEO|nr:hypothetical protein P171DRAFT_162979 [Karstenula rhodostoma CBS 690.94]